jgi:hypothetical protein
MQFESCSLVCTKAGQTGVMHEQNRVQVRFANPAETIHVIAILGLQS